MLKRIFTVLMLGALLTVTATAQKTTKITATVTGYSGKVIYFDFMEDRSMSQQFPYTADRQISFEVELKDVTMLIVNNYIWLVLQPGDDINVAIDYDATRYKTSVFKGSPSSAVVLNETIRDGRNARVASRYKMNPSAALVTLITPTTYCNQSLDLVNMEKRLMEANKAKMDPESYNYYYSELEGQYLTNLINYPQMYSGYNRLQTDSIPDNYWKVFDNFELRNDDASLKSKSYMALLLTLKEYKDRKLAHENNTTYRPEKDMQKAYESLAATYDGKIRDAALFVFLYNGITGGKDLDQLEKLIQQYFKQYNKNPAYQKTLAGLLK